MTALLLAATETPQGGGLASFVPLLLVVVVFYLLILRPQKRRARQQAELISSVGPGDRVVTIGGMHGTVASLDEDTMRLEVSPGTVVTMARSAVARKLVDAGSGTAEGAED